MDDPCHVAIGDQADRRAGLAHRLDRLGVAWPVEQDRRDLRRLHAFRLGQRHDVFVSRSIEIDGALRIARPDGDLVHVAVRRVQQRAFIGDRKRGDRTGHILGAQHRPLERIDGDIDFRSRLGADLLADEQHRRLVELALADHHRAVNRQLVELAAHRVDRGLVGGLVLAVAAQPRSRHRGALGDAHDLDGEDALQQLAGLNGDRRHRAPPV